MPLLLQTQAEPLAGYRLIEPLGKGGFGEVWKCEAPGGLFKAVKIVRNKPNALDGEGADAQAELQALEIVRSVRHPYLLSMDRIEIVDGVLVVVMELADESLYDQLRHYQAVGQAGVPARRSARPAVGGGRSPRRYEPPPSPAPPGRQAAQPPLARRTRQGGRLRPGQPSAGPHPHPPPRGGRGTEMLPPPPAGGGQGGGDADLPAGRRQPRLRLAGSLPGLSQPVQRPVQSRRLLPRAADRRAAVPRRQRPPDGAAARPRRTGPGPSAGGRPGRRRPRSVQRSGKALFVLHAIRRGAAGRRGARGDPGCSRRRLAERPGRAGLGRDAPRLGRGRLHSGDRPIGRAARGGPGQLSVRGVRRSRRRRRGLDRPHRRRAAVLRQVLPWPGRDRLRRPPRRPAPAPIRPPSGAPSVQPGARRRQPAHRRRAAQGADPPGALEPLPRRRPAGPAAAGAARRPQGRRQGPRRPQQPQRRPPPRAQPRRRAAGQRPGARRRLRPGCLVLAAVRPAAGGDQPALRAAGTRRQRRQPLLRSV